ncbi:MAG: class II aldolase/adducin family protein [Candidatus Colwellbacteria bacterium]|nr:class II aldolase/adducin family protein [Candidatus Colwellbacteria bacterium]
MFFSDKKWLKDWRVICDDQWDAEKLFDSYKKEMYWITCAGEELFSCGVLPAFAGTHAPEEYQKGTGGNFAIRKTGERKFLVTARGAHKGNLQRKDFVIVHEVDWWRQNIYISSLDNFFHLPSTDSPLIAVAFASCDNVRVWVHFHEIISAPHEVRLNYPALRDADWDTLKHAAQFGIREMNMIDHDLSVKGQKNNTVDSAIVLGEDPQETIFRARVLLERARNSPRI